MSVGEPAFERRLARGSVERLGSKRIEFRWLLARRGQGQGGLFALYVVTEYSILMDETLETRLRLLRRQVRLLTR